MDCHFKTPKRENGTLYFDDIPPSKFVEGKMAERETRKYPHKSNWQEMSQQLAKEKRSSSPKFAEECTIQFRKTKMKETK